MDDVLILGGGVIGLSLAYELAGRGLTVRVLDRAAPGQEASWAGAGILPPAGEHDDNPLEQLAALSGKLHRQWSEQLRAEVGIDNGYRVCGGLYVARSPAQAASLAETAAVWKRVGIDAQLLGESDLAHYEPALMSAPSAPSAAPPHAPSQRALAAIRLSAEAQIRNPWHLRALIAACSARGVNIEAGAAVERLVVRQGLVAHVETALGRRHAQRYVLTAGSWTASLAHSLGLRLALRPVRGQMVLLATPCPVLRHIVNDGSRYLVPRGDGRLLVGSTEEDVGFDKRNTAAGVESLLQLARELAPILNDATLERCWAGLRPCPADGKPYIGGVPEVENAFVAAGHFRGGLTLSTGTAHVLARHLCGELPAVGLEPFALDRAVAGAAP